MACQSGDEVTLTYPMQQYKYKVKEGLRHFIFGGLDVELTKPFTKLNVINYQKRMS